MSSVINPDLRKIFNSCENIQDLIPIFKQEGKVSVSFWGKRFLSIGDYEGKVSLDEVVLRVDELVKKAFRESGGKGYLRYPREQDEGSASTLLLKKQDEGSAFTLKRRVEVIDIENKLRGFYEKSKSLISNRFWLIKFVSWLRTSKRVSSIVNEEKISKLACLLSEDECEYWRINHPDAKEVKGSVYCLVTERVVSNDGSEIHEIKKYKKVREHRHIQFKDENIRSFLREKQGVAIDLLISCCEKKQAPDSWVPRENFEPLKSKYDSLSEEEKDFIQNIKKRSYVEALRSKGYQAAEKEEIEEKLNAFSEGVEDLRQQAEGLSSESVLRLYDQSAEGEPTVTTTTVALALPERRSSRIIETESDKSELQKCLEKLKAEGEKRIKEIEEFDNACEAFKNNDNNDAIKEIIKTLEELSMSMIR